MIDMEKLVFGDGESIGVFDGEKVKTYESEQIRRFREYAENRAEKERDSAEITNVSRAVKKKFTRISTACSGTGKRLYTVIR